MLLNRLRDIQRRDGMTDAEMAARLGCARSTWTETKNERLPLSEKLQIAAVRAYPELLGVLVTSVTAVSPLTSTEGR